MNATSQLPSYLNYSKKNDYITKDDYIIRMLGMPNKLRRGI